MKLTDGKNTIELESTPIEYGSKYVLMQSNRVVQQESIESCIERIPFLKIFIDSEDTLSSEIINEYMGFELIKPFTVITSDSINKLLIMAESRGDIK